MPDNLFQTRPHSFVIGCVLRRDILIPLWLRQTIQPNCSWISFFFFFFNKWVLLWKLQGFSWGLSQGLQCEEPKDFLPHLKNFKCTKAHSSSCRPMDFPLLQACWAGSSEPQKQIEIDWVTLQVDAKWLNSVKSFGKESPFRQIY